MADDTQNLFEEFRPFEFGGFMVTEAKTWDPNKFISQHARARSQERFPTFTTASWVGLIKVAIQKFGNDFVRMRDKAPEGYVGYRSFAISFQHNGLKGWLTLRVRRHPKNKKPRKYNLMAITVLSDSMPPLAKHNDVIRKLPPTRDRVPVKAKAMTEAEHQGKKVELNKPKRGGSKKFHVYVKDGQGKVKKVSFGDPNMEIKRDSPERRKSFRARHNCDSAKDKTTAKYWSCQQWRANAPVSESETLSEFQIPNNTKLKKRSSRHTMPQIESHDIMNFLKWAKEKYNVHNDLMRVDPKQLAPTQSNFNEEKVKGMAAKKVYGKKPILMSVDKFVLDGHHRWLAAVEDDAHKIDALRLKVKHDEALVLMRMYPKSKRKGINEGTKSFASLMEELDEAKKMKKEQPKNRNNVARHMNTFNKPKVFKDKKKYDRKRDRKIDD